MRIGGIYIYDDSPVTAEEFALHLGRNQFLWFAVDQTITDMETDVEFGGNTDLKLLEGYAFAIKKKKKKWYVRDSSNKKVLYSGRYEGETVEKQIAQYLKIFK